MAVAALGMFIVWFLGAFVARSIIQKRSTGDIGPGKGMGWPRRVSRAWRGKRMESPTRTQGSQVLLPTEMTSLRIAVRYT